MTEFEGMLVIPEDLYYIQQTLVLDRLMRSKSYSRNGQEFVCNLCAGYHPSKELKLTRSLEKEFRKEGAVPLPDLDACIGCYDGARLQGLDVALASTAIQRFARDMRVILPLSPGEIMESETRYDPRLFIEREEVELDDELQPMPQINLGVLVDELIERKGKIEAMSLMKGRPIVFLDR